MKNLLVAILAISSISAFAHNHEGKDLKHMVRFSGFNDDGASKTFDVSTTNKENSDDTDTKTTNIAINYAYAINNNWQVGVTYKTYSGEVSDNDVDRNTMGLSGYYNFGKSLDSTCYVGLHYDITNWSETDTLASEDDKQTDITLEYGHRFHVGHVWGLHLTYAPSIAYTTSTLEDDSADEDYKSSSLAWNWIKFDVLF
jgi:hypothetical protein